MHLRLTILPALAILAFLGPAGMPPAGAADQAKPLRKLTYHVVYDVQSTYTQATSGINPDGGSYSGSGTQRQDAIDKNEGTLTLAVIAATPDGGLLVEASFDGDVRSWRAGRLAIYADGRIRYDRRTEVGPEGERVIPFLARGLVADHVVLAGQSWVIPAPKPQTGSISYRVDAMDDPIAKMRVESDIHMAGAGAFDESTHAAIVYDTQRLCPKSVDVTAIDRRTIGMNANETTKSHTLATLTSDVFGG
jgi:hypothetical protein